MISRDSKEDGISKQANKRGEKQQNFVSLPPDPIERMTAIHRAYP